MPSPQIRYRCTTTQAAWSSRAPTANDIADARPWITPSKSKPSRPPPETIIFKPLDGLNLSETATTQVGLAITSAADLTAEENSQTYIKIHPQQNLLAVDNSCPTAVRKLFEITEISLGGRKHAVQTYLATRADQVKGVIHGVSGYTSQELMTCLHAGHRKILHARMMGQSNSAVITFEGVYPPRHITVHRAVTRVHPYRPRSTLCLNCLEIGHKTEVCPRKHTHRYCNVCSTPLAIDPEDEEPHKCVPHCINCDGDHAPTDPKCPSRLQADEDLAESMQAGQQRAARLRQRPNKYPPPPPLDDANYPHLQNRFSALRKSTSQDRSQSARRSSSRGRSKERSAPLQQRQKTPNKEREESVTRPTPAKRRLLASKT
ncbi:hypothetical protein HPB48_013577 [Haemaphysalis longicornis]|uniref:CCHC-type domain-containing protein n=1 Tax=Haemaphysalis longicornis TaxID=44386 RepID=A0A9J6GU19_HAELO|nr:hypothetical protein HPB48_013577 [Haemaphysalis longicornis]